MTNGLVLGKYLTTDGAEIFHKEIILAHYAMFRLIIRSTVGFLCLKGNVLQLAEVVD